MCRYGFVEFATKRNQVTPIPFDILSLRTCRYGYVEFATERGHADTL